MIPCIIPARGGSKGIPDKNLQLLDGLPLVAWPIRATLDAAKVSATLCSTDSPAIADAAMAAGAKCDRLRPADLSDDSTLVIDVLRHELKWLRRLGERPRHLCLVQATSPFVTARHIDQAIALAQDRDFDVVCTGRPVGPDHPDVMFELGGGNRVRWATSSRQRSRRRQDGAEFYVRSGLVYVFKTDHIDSCGDDYFSGSTGCLSIDTVHAQSIDDAVDLAWCQYLLDNHRNELGLEEK